MTYRRSDSPDFEPDAETDAAAADSDASAETVTIEVTKTPPARVLRSSSKKSDTVDNDADQKNNEGEEGNSKKGRRNKRKNTFSPKPQEKRRHSRKTKGKSVSFTLPPQRSVHRDNVDEQCRTLHITYKRWEGTAEPKNQLHKSHIPFKSSSMIPTNQEVPDNCILCPLKKYIRDNWDMNRHYNAVHIPNLICIDNTVALQCKCSDVRSRGWEKDRSTRNSHYHCTVCHWPRDRIPQLVNHMMSRHKMPPSSIRHLNKKK